MAAAHGRAHDAPVRGTAFLAVVGSLGGTGFLQCAGGPAPAGSAPGIAAETPTPFVNVLDFGAVGDGVTDDTASIQAAIDSVTVTTWQGTASAMYVRGGGSVQFNQGVYRITSPLRLGQHVRLVGVSTTGYGAPAYTQPKTARMSQKGSVIYADFEDPDQWAVESATYVIATGSLLGYRAQTSGTQVDSGAITATYGIAIENLFFVSGKTPVYGAIRLSSSADSSITNCGAFGFKIGYQVTASWGFAIRDSWVWSYWYGLIAAVDVNAFTVSNGYFARLTTPSALAPTASDVPLAVAGDYAPFGLSADYRLKTTGLYLHYANSFDVSATSEHWDVAAQFLHANGTVSRLYAEDLAMADVVTVDTDMQFSSIFSNSDPPVPRFDVGTLSRTIVATANNPPGFSYGSTSQYLISGVGDTTIRFSRPDRTAQEPWHVVGADGEPGFEHAWTSAGSDFAAVAFYRDTIGETHLRGLALGGPPTSAVFTLPVGYRPAQRLVFPQIDAAGSPSRVDVLPDGRVVPSGPGASVTLSLSFRAEQ
jgi:hypothetical protein